MNRPRAADDFTTIRARMEELRREREQAAEPEAEDPERASRGRGLMRSGESRLRSESERLPARRYGSGR